MHTWPFVLGCLLVVAATGAATSIISSSPMTYHENGQLLTNQIVEIECTDTNEFEFQVTREDTGEVDTVVVQCQRPEIRYSQQLYSYVPWSLQYKIPILELPTGTNFTFNSPFEDRVVNDQIANSDTSAQPIAECESITQSYCLHADLMSHTYVGL